MLPESVLHAADRVHPAIEHGTHCRYINTKRKCHCYSPVVVKRKLGALPQQVFVDSQHIGPGGGRHVSTAGLEQRCDTKMTVADDVRLKDPYPYNSNVKMTPVKMEPLTARDER